MNKNFYGEYSIHLLNKNEENIINVKNSTTELLKNYINYGYYYTTYEQTRFYYKNNLDPMQRRNWPYDSYAKFIGNILSNEYALPNYYIILYNCSDGLNIYETSKIGESASLLPVKEFFDIMRISDITIDKNTNKLLLKFKSSTVTVNNMSFNKIILMHCAGDYYNISKTPNDIFKKSTNNIYDDVYIDKGSAQISESNLPEPVVIETDTQFFIEYIFTFDYTELLNYPTGTFNYKYYENNQLKEKINEYFIKSDFIINIENAIGICEHIEKTYHENLELNKVKYNYSDEEYNFIKNKFKDIYWDPDSNIYKINSIFYKDINKKNEINKLLIPSRYINSSGNLYTQDDNHNYYFYMVVSVISDPGLIPKKYQYSLEKYILSDISFEEKIQLIQYYTHGLNIRKFAIPNFQIRNDADFIDKNLKMNKLNYIFDNMVNNKKYSFDDKFNSNNNNLQSITSEVRLYKSKFKNSIYYNYKYYDYFEFTSSKVYTILLKEDYIKLLENNNTYNLDYNYLNLRRGIYAISQFNYAYTIFFKEPIHKDLNLDFSLIPDISIGVQ